MSIVGRAVQLLSLAQARWHARRQSIYEEDLSFSVATQRYSDRNAIHAYMHHHFRHLCPAAVRAHRSYFNEGRRGFGEDAFHAMWWTLLREFRPHQCLEIGVYRGQVITLWALIAKMLEFRCDVHGISPFSALGDAVSIYPEKIDYLADTLASYDAFGLPAPTLVKALSTAPAAVQHIANVEWDLVYIDGSHDYDEVLADYRLCRDHLRSGGLLVMDDASLGTSYRPRRFSFAGHPGPSRVAADFAMKELHFLGAVGHNNIFRNIGPNSVVRGEQRLQSFHAR